MHYSRFKAHGDPLLGRRVVQDCVCQEVGCPAKPVAKNLCKTHYYRRQRAAARPSSRRIPGPAPCSVSGCDSAASARGWCGAHYQRWRRFGDPEFYPPQMPRNCTIGGCDLVANGRGLCNRHYYRWSRYGDPLYSKNRPRTHKVMHAFPKRICRTCGVEFDPGTSNIRIYCGRRCKPSGRISGSVNNRRWVEKLGAEDGWVCWLCAGKIDRSLYWPHRWAGSVDHVVHVSNGGTDERSNLRLAHVTCNASRGNSDDQFQPARQGA